MIRTRHYDLTKSEGQGARSYGFQLWHTSSWSNGRKWTLDIWFGKNLWAIWRERL